MPRQGHLGCDFMLVEIFIGRAAFISDQSRRPSRRYYRRDHASVTQQRRVPLPGHFESGRPDLVLAVVGSCRHGFQPGNYAILRRPRNAAAVFPKDGRARETSRDNPNPRSQPHRLARGLQASLLYTMVFRSRVCFRAQCLGRRSCGRAIRDDPSDEGLHGPPNARAAGRLASFRARGAGGLQRKVGVGNVLRRSQNSSDSGIRRVSRDYRTASTRATSGT